jgi:pheromone shutdown protein TraB
MERGGHLGGPFGSSILRQPQDLIALEESHREVHYPKGNEGRTKIQERDVYIVCRLLQLCQMIIKPKRVVVIIGAAHLQGMQASLLVLLY